MSTTPHHRPEHRRTPRRRTAVVSATVALTGALVLAGTGTAGATEATEATAATDLPSVSGAQSQVSGAVEDSAEYGGYVVGSVQEFFRLPADQAVAGSGAAGALALCLLLPDPPVPDGTCVI